MEALAQLERARHAPVVLVASKYRDQIGPLIKHSQQPTAKLGCGATVKAFFRHGNAGSTELGAFRCHVVATRGRDEMKRDEAWRRGPERGVEMVCVFTAKPRRCADLESTLGRAGTQS